MFVTYNTISYGAPAFASLQLLSSSRPVDTIKVLGSVYYDGSVARFQSLERWIHAGITSMWFKNEILQAISISSVGRLG